LHESNRLGFSRGSWLADRAAGLAAWLAKRHLYAQVSDQRLRNTLSPQYNFGCKRVLVSDDFYPSLSKPNVALVTDPIQSVEPSGIKVSGGRQFQHDVIVCATGFKLDHLAYAVDVRGLDGISIQSQFSDGPQAYLGTMVTKMPNLFLLLGPNTATGHTSTLLYIEAQVQMSLKLVQALASEGKSSLVVKQSIFEQHNEQLQKRFSSTSWSGSCSSWYKIGQGRNIVIWPGSTRQFWKSLASVRLNDFDLA
jgi:cation diffusion facilitator CzcD-associated flavoprotein CzcO